MMARALALNGASHVFILGRRLEPLESTASSIPTANIHPIQCDVTSKDSLSAAVKAITETHSVGAIDVLICNSGISGPGVGTVDAATNSPIPLPTLIENMWAPTFEGVTTTYSTNLTATHFTIAAFLPLLAASNSQRPNPPSTTNFRPRPQIITTGSIGGFSRKALGNLSYGPSKAALMHFTKQLAVLLIPYDIRANSIAPGLYLSEMTEGMYAKQGKTDAHNVEGTWGKEAVPATRTGDELDMAGAILFLCSRAGAYIWGNVLVSDGGRLGIVPGSY
jgi:NAD(P)-dependent dehydrogenase (short-subunit alcohol dehydrogenase family)